MKKLKLDVPEGVRYISEWKEFKLFDFPHILNKQIPGCGFTEYCINCSSDIILCSPRRILLENKRDQHVNDVLYISNASNDTLNVDKDLSRMILTKRKTLTEDEKLSEEDGENEIGEESSLQPGVYESVYNDILAYTEERKRKSLPFKILVTYDSFGLVKDVIKNLGILYRFHVIVDEFQSIFIDSKFKSTTEISFLRELHNAYHCPHQLFCHKASRPTLLCVAHER